MMETEGKAGNTGRNSAPEDCCIEAGLDHSQPSQETQASKSGRSSPHSAVSPGDLAEIMRGSSEIQADIRALYSLCGKLSSEKKAVNESTLNVVQRKLEAAGFREISLGEDGVPTAQALCQVLDEVLTELCDLRVSNSHLFRKLEALSVAHKSLSDSFQSLSSRLHRPRPSPSSKALEVFRHFLHREYKPDSDSDNDTMALILVYESRLKGVKSRPEVATFSEMKEGSGLEEQVKALLGVQQNDDIIAAIEHMNATLPRFEQFARGVCFAVFPEMEEAGDYWKAKAETVISVIENWRELLIRLRRFRDKVCRTYWGQGEQGDADELVLRTQTDMISFDRAFHTKFSQLFDVPARSDSFQCLERVFLFVHHTKAFLKVPSTQDSKRLLAFESDDVSVVFDRILSHLAVK